MKAFLDTTILTTVLLKEGRPRDTCLIALKRYESTEMPVYAIKEFKAGPLSYWVWLHNKLKVGHSLAEGITAIRALNPLQVHRKATALEALEYALQKQKNVSIADWPEKYGGDGEPDRIMADRIRFSMRRRIAKAWNDRHKIADKTVLPLSCYHEVSPQEGKDGLLDIQPIRCDQPDCYLAKEMKKDPASLVKIRDSLSKLPQKPENVNRLRVIKEMIRVPKREVSDELCRKLGDAVFAFFAPPDAAILTTNAADHLPLAEALGKQVETP